MRRLRVRFCYKKKVFYWQKTHNAGTRSGQMSVCEISLLPLISQTCLFAEKYGFQADFAGCRKEGVIEINLVKFWYNL